MASCMKGTARGKTSNCNLKIIL